MPTRKMQDLRDRAGAFAAAAADEPVKKAFIDHDCAATFVEDLEAAIEAFASYCVAASPPSAA